MILGEFLKVVADEMIQVENGCKGLVLYEADKNAIRMYKPELLDREVYMVEPRTKRSFIVHLTYIEE